MILYASYKDAWDAIAVYRPQIAEVSKHFAEPTAMETALGYATAHGKG